METDELAQYLESLKREDCYRVDAVLKESPFETTQRVSFVGANGAESGPFIRKFIARDTGMGAVYERIFAAQRAGRRFKYVPSIVECYQRDDCLVVVMELVRGETLQDYVYREDPSPALAASVFPRLCDAVAELHEEFNPPIIHRDLKPSNIILSGGDGLAIIDYGIAREFHEGAETDTAQFGTRAFAPPEQFGFGQTTIRSDVYALGMLLYYCLTETIPTNAVRDAQFADPRIPETLRQVIARATALDPADRYASAAELKAAFQQASGLAAESALAPGSASANPAAALSPYAYAVGAAMPAAAPTTVSDAAPSPVKLFFKSTRNVIILIVLVFFLLVCVNSIVNPTAEAAQNSMVFNVLAYLVFMPILFIGTALLLCDKAWLKACSARLRNWTLKNWLIFYAVVWLVVFFGIGFSGTAFPS